MYEDFYDAATLTAFAAAADQIDFSQNLSEQGKTCGSKSAILLLTFIFHPPTSPWYLLVLV